MEIQEIVVIEESIKLSSLVLIWIFMSCYSMKKDFDHFRGYEKYGLWKNLCNSKGCSTLCGPLTPGKDNDIPRSGLRTK